MTEPIRIDRSKMSAADRLAATTPLAAFDPAVLHADKVIARLRSWNGARAAVHGAVEGAQEYPQIALRYDLEDGSTIALKLMTEKDTLTPAEVYQSAGGLPILKVLVIDNGQQRGHLADKAWMDVAKYIRGVPGSDGVAEAAAIIGQSVNEQTARRAHYWRLEA